MFKPIIDAYDSDWMKAPMAAVAFMANLSSTRAHQHQVNEGMLIPLHPLTMPLEYGILNRSWYHQVVSMKKKNEKPGHAYCHSSNERASQTSNPNSPVTPFVRTQSDHQIFDELEAEYEQCVLDNKNLTIEKKNLLIKNDCLIAECLEKDICSNCATSDNCWPPSSSCLATILRSACDREHTKFFNLEAEVFQQQKMKAASKGKMTLSGIRRLRSTITRMLKYVPLKEAANTHSRTAYTEKLSALTAENTKLKAQVTGKTSSGPSTSETPKVLAPGMYNLGSKKAADHNKKLHVVDHNQFVIRSLKSVNTKTPQAKHSVNHTKKVWKATRNHNVNTTKTAWRPTRKVVGSVKPQWKPTGRYFACMID
ncbi:hypothetical protein Tco_0729533 [Tanacetum coccineum]|uniref:Uncharacterized protein n=1 Tax=Tanacetum coccineum TaxID=301880 RepID=A0ABQ4YQ23_9ASTR